jgi:hypothetical protein
MPSFNIKGLATSKITLAVILLKPVPPTRLSPKVPSPVKLLAAAPTYVDGLINLPIAETPSAAF